MTAKNIVAGNWKMNLGPEDAKVLTQQISSSSEGLTKTEVWITPTAISAYAAIQEARNSSIKVGAQNVHWEDSGAFTGELSVPMLKEAGCSFAIVGHSERRHVFGETNEMTAKRASSALKKNFPVIFCIGETLSEREQAQTNTVLGNQLDALIDSLEECNDSLVLAYEPIWAIGTGKVASIDEIKEAHTFIQNHWRDKTNKDCPRILYGGSVTPDNFGEIIKLSVVDGGLVGGASLKADKFSQLIEISEKS